MKCGHQNSLSNDMDYSNIEENIKASEAADLQYAQWYAQQPDARKSAMMLSGYKMVADNVTQQVKAKNPFSTQSDVTMRFIEVTQKADYSADTFAFILETMQKRSEKEWQQRFKAMKKTLGWSYEDMATFMGAENAESVKSSINRKLPAFAKLAVCVFEHLQNQKT